MSIAMSATALLLRSRSNPVVRRVAGRWADLQTVADAPIPTRLLAASTVGDVGGHRVTTLTPDSGSGVELVYLHGGSYLHPVIWPHWSIVGDLMSRTGATVTVPSYGLAPEHTAIEALPFLDQVLDRIRERAPNAPVVLAGDSAGGGLAIAAATHVRDTGARAPVLLVLFSPWVDVTMTNPEITAVERVDPSLDRQELRDAGRMWAGGLHVADPRVSPIFGTLGGLPPIVTYQGGHDILAPDARLFTAQVRKAGGTALLRYFPRSFHVFVGAGWTPEARSALRDAARHIRAAGHVR